MDISDVVTGEDKDFLLTMKYILKEKRRFLPKVDREIFNCVYMLVRIQTEAYCLAKILSEARERFGAVLNDESHNQHINYPPLFDMFSIGAQELNKFENYMRNVIEKRLEESNKVPIN